MGPIKTNDKPSAHFDTIDAALALLALGAGCMDALGFFALGGALPSAVTGNTALLGLALGRGDFAASRPFAASIGFILGAGVAALLVDLKLARLSGRGGAAWLPAVEALLLIGFVVAWQFVDRRVADLPLHLLIVLGAGAMALQSAAARLDNRPGVSTVVFTLMFHGVMTAVVRAALGTSKVFDPAARRQMVMFAVYGLGAAVGGVLSFRAIVALPFVPALASITALCLHVGASINRNKPESLAVPSAPNALGETSPGDR